MCDSCSGGSPNSSTTHTAKMTSLYRLVSSLGRVCWWCSQDALCLLYLVYVTVTGVIGVTVTDVN